MISEVKPGGEADRVGLRRGDAIVTVQGVRLDDQAALAAYQSSHPRPAHGDHLIYGVLPAGAAASAPLDEVDFTLRSQLDDATSVAEMLLDRPRPGLPAGRRGRARSVGRPSRPRVCWPS